jgi:transglutaminase-like putative cysteine protease
VRAPHWEPFDSSAAAPAGAQRLVLLDSEEIHFGLDSDGHAYADLIEHQRIKALAPRALDPAVNVPFDHAFRQRPTIEGRVLFPDGTTQPLDATQQWDTPVWATGFLYAGMRALHQPVPVVPKRGVLEYRVRQRLTDLKPFQFSFDIGGAHPVSLAQFVVVAPASWEVEWLAQQLEQRQQREPMVDSPSPGLKRYTWEARDLLPLPHEPYGVEPSLAVPVISVRLKSWEDGGQKQTAFATPREMSAWVWEQTQALDQPDEAMRATVRQVLTGAGDDPREKARLLYEYTCEKVQYCAIEVGYGGWFPHAAKAVQQNRYGDCKDKANYLKALLKVAGISSRATLLYAHQGFPRGIGMPSLAANFNHAILTIDLPDGPLFVDPTARTVAFGDLPSADREATVLPIAQGGADPLTVPTATPAQHRSEETFDLTLRDDGSATGTFTVEATGAIAAELRGKLIRATAGKRGDVMSEWLEVADAWVSAVQRVDGLELRDGLSVSGAIELPSLALMGTTARGVRLSSLASRWLPVLPDVERHTPFVLPTRLRRHGTLRLRLPASSSVLRLPADVTVSNRWFDYRLSFSTQDGALLGNRELVLKERIASPGELEELRRGLQQIHQAENAIVLVGSR